MHNPLKRFIEFIKTPGHSRTISVVVILIIAAAIPLTVLVAQQQQQTQQHASVLIPCNPLKNTCNQGATSSCRCGGRMQCSRVNISKGACYMWTGSCFACPTKPTCAKGTTCTNMNICRSEGRSAGGVGCNGANTVCCKFTN